MTYSVHRLLRITKNFITRIPELFHRLDESREKELEDFCPAAGVLDI